MASVVDKVSAQHGYKKSIALQIARGNEVIVEHLIEYNVFKLGVDDPDSPICNNEDP